MERILRSDSAFNLIVDKTENLMPLHWHISHLYTRIILVFLFFNSERSSTQANIAYGRYTIVGRNFKNLIVIRIRGTSFVINKKKIREKSNS